MALIRFVFARIALCALIFLPALVAQCVADDRSNQTPLDSSSQVAFYPVPVLPPTTIWVRVLYVTNRVVSGPGRRVEDYSNSVARRDASLGTSIVAIPCDHRIGTLESASIFRFQFHNDPRKHITVLSVAPHNSDQFSKELSSRVASSHGREVLVFIHGLNVSFEDSLRRTATVSIRSQIRWSPNRIQLALSFHRSIEAANRSGNPLTGGSRRT